MKRILALSLALSLAGCACGGGFDDAEGTEVEPPSGGGDGGGLGDCVTDADCPLGLRCDFGLCVTPDDGRPPEEERDATFLRPVAGDRFVYAISPNADSLAVIDPATLDIEAVILPEEPIAARAVPGRDAAVILSRRGEAISLVRTDAAGTSLVIARTGRAYAALTLSPDGRWAVLWTPEGELPDAGAEGIVALVDLDALERGEASPVERAAGRRHTDVFFRMAGPRAAEAVVVGKEEVAAIDLGTLDEALTAERIFLPEGYREIVTREAIPAPDGSFVLFRSLAAPELALLDVAERQVATLALPALATDVDLAEDGTFAVAALRASSQLAVIPLPGALTVPGSVALLDATGVVPGQVELSLDGRFAVTFTNSEDSETFGLVDLAAPAPAVELFPWLEKWIDAVGLGPDGRTAVVVHRPNPGSTVADLYERDVDVQQGYSVVDLEGGFAQLKLTGTVRPGEFVFSQDGRHAAVTLRDDRTRTYRVDAVDLETLVAATLPLASAPEYAGALTSAEPDLADRVWVTQVHPAGRISFVDLEERSVRTATGYELNSDVD